ncbi:kirola-like [Olea europaea subsp. europaea]|uniref:Kirola-like n=1 Tax=Olea europaea subsp. europaea TaxID=158383 RepID=A0A8S0R1M6_OLEEU|nr:kirola-like [Olea europaea subsp. europaea]
MGLTGKLIAQLEFEAGGDAFHEFFRHKPHQLSDACVGKVHSCDLVEGEFGKVGCVVIFGYAHDDGKEQSAKMVLDAIDEEKQALVVKVLEGDVMEFYKTFTITAQVETKDDIDHVTWTLEYEMLHEDVPHPISWLAYYIDITVDVETHHLKKY